ncbi:MAG: aminoacyl-tRNA hydrolase [Bacteroidetes bacterium]|nr:aminoacyl-tRNA hydrolase [Bacteroidota bacterium]
MDSEKILREITFKAVRSGGPGGQHVNKTASKVEVKFNIKDTQALSEKEKEKLFDKLSTRITSEGILKLSCSETRSQHRNKAIVIDRLFDLIKIKLKNTKLRKKTKPSKNAIEKRLISKKNQALKKVNRRPPKID